MTMERTDDTDPKSGADARVAPSTDEHRAVERIPMSAQHTFQTPRVRALPRRTPPDSADW
jgi:hypothetical protein